MNNKKLKMGILLILTVVLLSFNVSADLYLNSKTGYINLNTTGETRLQITPGGNLNLLGVANVSISGNLSVGGNVSVDGSTLFVDSNGNRVGIGTTAPGQALDVNGTAHIGSFNYTRISEAGTSDIEFFLSDSGQALINPVRIDANNGALTFQTKQSGSKIEVIRLDQNGNVGIGTTSPQYLLQVSNATNAVNLSGIFYINGSSGFVGVGTSGPQEALTVFGTSADIRIRQSNGNRTAALESGSTGEGALYLYNGETGSENQTVFIRSDGDSYFNGGNVGIGTTSPGAKLVISDVVQVQGSASPIFPSSGAGGEIAYDSSATSLGGTGQTLFGSYDRTGSAWKDVSVRGLNVGFYTNGGLQVKIDSDGKVGIGTTSPATTLQVIGNASFATTSGAVAIATTGGMDTSKLRVQGPIWITAADGDLFVLDGDGPSTISAAKWIFQRPASTNNMVLNATNVNGNFAFMLGTGNVGIGTTSPEVPLSVKTTATNNVANFSSTGTTSNVIIDGTQNTNAKLTLVADGITGNGAYVDLNNGSTQNWAIGMGIDGNDDFQFFDGANTRMHIDRSSGSVGIGTTGPLDALHVQSAVSTVYRGNLLLSDSTAIAAGVGGQINFGGKYTGSTYTEWAGIQGAKATATDGEYGGDLLFRTRLHGAALSTKMIIQDDGNVGIGTTAPGAQLYIGDGTGTAVKSIQIDNAATGLIVLGLENTAGGGLLTGSTASAGVLTMSGNLPLQFGTNDGVRMTILGDGNVGIGETSPDFRFHVLSDIRSANLNSETDALFVGSANGLHGITIWEDGGTGEAYIANAYDNSAGDIHFATKALGSGTVKMTIEADGNVGIGTTAPTELLVVAGNANITGTLYKGTSAYTNPDIAEMMQSPQELEEGDIVIVDPNNDNKVIKSNKKFQTAIGIVSPNATMVIGDWKGGFSGEKIAMFGRVLVKVTNERGMVNRGDLLTTSSKPGYAMKCENRAECHYEVLGVAMWNQNTREDKILMVIKR